MLAKVSLFVVALSLSWGIIASFASLVFVVNAWLNLTFGLHLIALGKWLQVSIILFFSLVATYIIRKV